MNLYLDESGDLGFNFNKPFRKGGSRRYLTISFLLIPGKLSHLPKRIIRKIYDKRKQPPHVELKGRNLTSVEKTYFADQAGRLLIRQPQIKIISMTINKKAVNEPILQDFQQLLSSISLHGLIERIQKEPSIRFIPNNRSIKEKNSRALMDYIQTELWFECDSNTVVENNPKESPGELNLQFLDWVGHIIWKKYEDNESQAYDILKNSINLTPWWETLSNLLP